MVTRRSLGYLASPLLLVGLICAGVFLPAVSSAQDLDELPLELPDDPPASPSLAPQGVTLAPPIVFGRFTSIQVNVSATGNNILNDAANEPTIAVDPLDHDRMAIGWRQFDNIGSNFRQAGFAYTTNGGATWTAGKIQSGTFRSDPVLGIDADGDFFYLSLDGNLHTQFFPTTNHGQTWGAAVQSFGGDKPWLTIDRTAGTGRNFVHHGWQHFGNPYAPNTFTRSINDGVSFQSPSVVPNDPSLGTLDVGPDGTLYVVGVDRLTGITYVAHSTDADDGGVTPSFTSVPIDLGGGISSGPPNPEGLLGQYWIAVDRSAGPRSGGVYVLASASTPTDPLDVMFTRSADGGTTWSPPVRVNDDPTDTRAFQWFGTMSVSPDGSRIDAVWNDTRGTADSTISALYYAYSLDGGTTWSANEQASPTWDAQIGYPRQMKIGDYYHMISDDDGADLAYSATFTGGQDVYYLRLTRPMVAVETRALPRAKLHPSSPNPFRVSTTIRYEVPAGGAKVGLEVIDTAGRRVATLVEGFRSEGANAATWDGRGASGHGVAPGVYVCRYQAPGWVETRRLVLMR